MPRCIAIVACPNCASRIPLLAAPVDDITTLALRAHLKGCDGRTRMGDTLHR